MDLRAFVAEGIRVHPRVAYQGLANENTAVRIAAALPPIVPFRGHYAGALCVLDWDHRLPSRQLILRIYGYYTAQTLAAGGEAYDDRVEAIAERDVYPEFDVPDFGGLPADEAYEVDVATTGEIEEVRLTSAWRRNLSPSETKKAVALVAKFPEYQTLREGTKRPAFLGDLEAVSWAPPCETAHARWTIDVWFLLRFDGRVGSGRSFLVDMNDGKVVLSREFSVMAG